MKHWSYVVLIALAIIAFLILAACGEDAAPGSDGGDKWTSITDPATNREFRCLSIWRMAGTHAGGPAMWCYENRESQP